MINHSISARLGNKHDTQTEWDKLQDFIPIAGEIIVYDPDEYCSYQRFKIGDGKTKLCNLLFVVLDSETLKPSEALEDAKAYTDTQIEAKELFVATYNVTTYQEIIDAVNAGRVVQTKDENGVYYNLIGISEDESYTACMFSVLAGDESMALICTPDGWEKIIGDIVPATRTINGHQLNSDITLSASDVKAVSYESQTLTEEQKAQVRSNIGAGDSAFSGDYNDLENKPTIPDSLSDLTADSTHRTVTDAEKTAWNAKSNFSGSYNDLTNKPTIPTVPTKVSAFENDKGYLTSYTEADPTVPSHVKNITSDDISNWNNKSEFSGNYNDLSNKPTIPTVYDATLTIQKNGAGVGTFTANSSSDVTVNITVPTVASDINAADVNHPHDNYASSVTTTGNGNAITSISQSGNKITATKGSTFLTAHPTISTSTDSTSTASPAHGGTFTAIDSVTRDSNGHVTKINTKTITLPPAVTASDLGLEQVMKFLGTSSTAISDGSTTSTITVNSKSINVTSGNVVLYNGYEYVWTGAAWEQLGQEGSFSLKTHSHTVSYTPAGTVSQPTFTGTEAGHTHSFSSTGSHDHTFTGTAANHNHTFTGTGTMIKASFAGTEQTASASYTPAGTVSQPTITVTPNTTTVYSITEVGSVPSLTYTEVKPSKITAWSAGTAPSASLTAGSGSASLTGSVSTGPNRTVTLNFSHTHTAPSLSFSAGTVPSLTYEEVAADNITAWSAGSVPTKGSATTVVTGIKSATSTQPTFSGTAATISHKHTPSGTVTITTSAPGSGEIANYTPSGTVNNTSVTPAGTVGSKSITLSGTTGETKLTPAGTVSKPTFSGTLATLTTSAANS